MKSTKGFYATVCSKVCIIMGEKWSRCSEQASADGSGEVVTPAAGMDFGRFGEPGRQSLCCGILGLALEGIPLSRERLE